MRATFTAGVNNLTRFILPPPFFGVFFWGDLIVLKKNSLFLLFWGTMQARVLNWDPITLLYKDNLCVKHLRLPASGWHLIMLILIRVSAGDDAR